MKILSKEFVHSYKKYLFGYTLHAEREENELLDVLYEKGFLPYTGDTKVRNTYYMARSCRIDLEKFNISSENRRIQKKFLHESFIKNKSPAADYLGNDIFINFCLEYFSKQHGDGIFSKERLQFVLGFSKEVNVIKYTDKQNCVKAYIIEVECGNSSQYWFSFYDIDLAQQSFGIWLMLDCIIDAKEKKLKHFYLGTVYGEKALYKTNFNALQYWDGNAWQCNITDLKKLAREDKENGIL